MNPTKDTDNRYHRQMLLSQIGVEGQKILAQSRVLIAGCGALGTHVADLLGRAGVGTLIIADRDFVEMSNLQRQVLYDEEDARNSTPKAEAAKKKLQCINSNIDITAIIDDINSASIQDMIFGSDGKKVDLIVDGLDNFETRFLLNDAAVKWGIPYIYAGAVASSGTGFSILPHTLDKNTPWEKEHRATPCLRCLFDTVSPPGMTPTCDTVGVLGPLVGVVANIEACEALKILTHQYESVHRQLWEFDLWSLSLQHYKVNNAYEKENCACCKNFNFEHLEGLFSTTTTSLCGRNAVQLLPKRMHTRLDLNEVANQLKSVGNVKVNPFMLLAHVQHQEHSYELSIFGDGRCIVKGTKQPNVAKTIYAKFIGI